MRAGTVLSRPLMCFAFDAVPPDLPADLARPLIAGGAGAELLELTSADGTHFSAALAESPEPSGARGRDPARRPRPVPRSTSELAERFAQAGHHAVALDYFGRTAGLGPRDEEFEYMPHVRPDARRAGVQADAAAALAALRERTGATARRDRRLLLRRDAVVPRRRRTRRSSSTASSASTAPRPGALGRPRADRARGRDARPGARALRRRRRGHPARPDRGASRRGWPRPASTTRSSSTRARRTRSSTAATRSTRTPAVTRGGACSASCSAARSSPS